MTTLTFDPFVGPPFAVFVVFMVGVALSLLFLFSGIMRQEKPLLVLRNVVFMLFITGVLLLSTYGISMTQIGHDRVRDALVASGVEVIDLSVPDVETVRGRIVNEDGLVHILGDLNIGEGVVHYSTIPKDN